MNAYPLSARVVLLKEKMLNTPSEQTGALNAPGVEFEKLAAAATPLSNMPMPLRGVKVIAIEQVFASPLAGVILADLGADVLKVERLEGGDDTRWMGQHFTMATHLTSTVLTVASVPLPWICTQPRDTGLSTALVN